MRTGTLDSVVSVLRSGVGGVHAHVRPRTRPMLARASLIAVGTVLICGRSAVGQWTVTLLHPPGASESQAVGLSGTSPAGTARFTSSHAGLWAGPTLSWLDLNPTGTSESHVLGARGSQQVGFHIYTGLMNFRASLWSGTRGSWVDLNPTGASSSVARGTSGSQQVGYADIAGVRHAGLWTGVFSSWVDLAPTGSSSSEAYGAAPGQQAGFAYIGGVEHPGLWSGSAASWVDLKPAAATRGHAWDTSGTQQVGDVQIAGVTRASLWSGTAASRVDLHPAGATFSKAQSISGPWQAGVATVGGVDRAVIWNGTAASWQDLSLYVPGSWGYTAATSVWTDGLVLKVTGVGRNNATMMDEALLWTRQLCSSASVTAQPVPATTCPNGAATFTIAAAGTAPIACQWQIESSPGTWINLGDGDLPFDGGLVVVSGSGTTQLVLSLSGLGGSSSLSVRCSLTNACSAITTDPATLTISCRNKADVAHVGGVPGCDGLVTVDDIVYYLNQFFANNAAVADIVGIGGVGPPEGAVTVDDLVAFLSAFFAGCP